MKRLFSWVLIALISALSLSFGAIEASAQSNSLPAGVPKGAERATVTGFMDGDTFKVSLNREGQVIQLAGIDAPNEGDCFADESADRLRELIPRKTKVYLQTSGERNQDGRLARFVWVAGEDGEKAYLLNTKLVREGYAGYASEQNLNRYEDNLEEAQDSAQDNERGVWGACDGLHSPVAPPPTPTPEPPAAAPAQEETQSGYTAAEIAYVAEASAILDLFLPSLERFGELSSLAGIDATYIFDPTWQREMATQLGIWHVCYARALELNPPASLMSVHIPFVEGFRLYAEAANQIAYGIDYIDAASLDYGGSLMNQGTAMLEAATDELGAFVASRE